MATTFADLAKRAFVNLGVIAADETMPPRSSEDARQRCNHMVSGWQTSRLTSLAVERWVFPLTANQQTYTIGVGAEFNVPRPVFGLNGAGLLLNGLNPSAVISGITRVGSTATATTTLPHGLSVGDDIVVTGATDYNYNGTVLVQAVPTGSTFQYTVENAPATPSTGSPVFQTFTSPAATEIPRGVLTDDGYQGLQLKRLTSTLFTDVYYNATQPFGSIFLWPCPTTAQNQLVLYLQSVFTGFANLTTLYDWPDVPGYAEAIEYNLSIRLARPYGAQTGDPNDPASIPALARKALADIKRANYKLSDLPQDPALAMNRRAGYNIQSGTGGGIT